VTTATRAPARFHHPKPESPAEANVLGLAPALPRRAPSRSRWPHASRQQPGSPGPGSSRLPGTPRQLTPGPSAAGSVPAQRFACFSFRYRLLPALRPAPL